MADLQSVFQLKHTKNRILPLDSAHSPVFKDRFTWYKGWVDILNTPPHNVCSKKEMGGTSRADYIEYSTLILLKGMETSEQHISCMISSYHEA